MRSALAVTVALTFAVVGCTSAQTVRRPSSAPAAAPPVVASSATTSTTTVFDFESQQAQEYLPVALHFPDAEHGVALTAPCTNSDCFLQALRTNDSGSTWAPGARQAFPAVPSYTDRLNLYLIAGLQDFLAVPDRGHAGYESFTGGQTWSKVEVPAGTAGGAVSGDGFLVYTDSCAPQPVITSTCSGQLYRQTATTTFSEVGPIPTGGLPMIQLLALSDQNLIAVAGIPGAPDLSNSDRGAFRLITSSDGGHDWIQQMLPCPHTPGLTVGAPASARDDLWALCTSEPSAGSQLKQLYTKDGQGGWQAHPDPGSGGYQSDLYIETPTSAWLAGSGRAFVLHTADGGNEWRNTQAPMGEMTGGAPSVFDPINGDQAFIATYNLTAPDTAQTPRDYLELIRTIDGGQHWSTTPLPDGSPP